MIEKRIEFLTELHNLLERYDVTLVAEENRVGDRLSLILEVWMPKGGFDLPRYVDASAVRIAIQRMEEA